MGRDSDEACCGTSGVGFFMLAGVYEGIMKL
jgi:hypothetical protein